METGETEPAYSVYSSQIPVTENGEYNIKYYSQDAAWNTETEQSIVVQLDTEFPIVAVANAPLSWQATSADLNVACSDGDLSGCSTPSYLIKEFSEGTDCSTADYSGASDTLTMSAHGYVCAMATDNAGNAAYSSLTEILIDTDGPLAEITSPSDGASLTGDTMVIVNATDSLSGIDEVTFELKNALGEVIKSGSLTYNEVTKKYNAMLSNVLEDVPAGDYTLEATATDAVGNSFTDSITLHAVEYVLPVITSVVSNAPFGQIAQLNSIYLCNKRWKCSKDENN